MKLEMNMKEALKLFTGDGTKVKQSACIIFEPDPNSTKLCASIYGFDGVKEPLKWNEARELQGLLRDVTNRIMNDLFAKRRKKG